MISAVFVEHAVARIRLTRDNVATGAVTIADAAQPLYRDVAVAIRATQPTGDVVLLGRGEYLDRYLELARPLAPRAEAKQTFGYRLMQDDSLPRWLRPLPFAMRRGATAAELQVRVMQVVPAQSEPTALWNIALARLAAGDTAAAEQDFRSAIALFPTSERASRYDAAARLAFRADAHRVALRLFRETLAIAPTMTTRVAVAWILATGPDDSARDGTAALAMMEPLVKQSPNDPALIDVLSAALAETGHFADAVTIADRVAAIHRRAGDAAAEARFRERLGTYRAGRPWRTR